MLPMICAQEIAHGMSPATSLPAILE